MSNIVLPGEPGDVVKVDGTCYVLAGPTSSSSTHALSAVEAVFDTCEECGSSSSSSNSGSASSSSSPSLSSSSSVSQSSSSSSGFSSSSSGQSNPCSPEPSVLATVTGASGTVNWCGETWNLPGDSGDTRAVCANTIYSKSQGVFYGTFSTIWTGQHAWVATGLRLQRQFQRSTIYGSCNFQNFPGNWLSISPGGLTVSTRQDERWWYGPCTAPSLFTQYGGLGLILTAPGNPDVGDYDITDNFFGSVSRGGITYSWAKGAGW